MKKGESPKPGVFYLKEMCAERGIQHSGSKPALIRRLVAWFFNHPHEFEHAEEFQGCFDVQKWLKAKEREAAERTTAQRLVDANSGGRLHDSPIETGFRVPLLSIAYKAYKNGLFPTTTVFHYHGLWYSREAMLQEFKNYDLSQFGGMDAETTLDMHSSGREVTRRELDSGAIGSESPFWVDVHKAFIDDNFDVGSLVVDFEQFMDRAGQPPDLSICRSKWVTPKKLYEWYNDAHNRLVTFRKNFDTSGTHDFSLEGPGFAEFCNQFAHGARDIMYLAAWALFRGNEALEFFCATIPDNQNPIDGLHVDEDDSLTNVTSMIASSSKSTKKRQGDEDINRLVAAMTAGSPMKEKYYEEKCKKLCMENMNAKVRGDLKMSQKKISTIRNLLETAQQLEDSNQNAQIVSRMRDKAAGLSAEL